MASDVFDYPRCTCSAIFPTSGALNAHLEENRSLKSYLIARVDICKGHEKADNKEDSLTGSEDGSREKAHGRKEHCCPVQDCGRRSAPFSSRQRLRRHFEQHVDCSEVCVICHRVMTCARSFIRHVERHSHASETKMTYMNRICDELRDRANGALKEFEAGRNASASRKRTRDVAELDNHASESQRRRRNGAEQTRDILRWSSVDGDYPDPLILDNDAAEGHMFIQEQPASDQYRANSLTLPTSTDGVADPLLCLQTDILTASSALEQTGFLDGLDFDAPVNGVVNFPDFFEAVAGI